ncbi:hypothetical protein NP493_1883g00014 [Ridgeia piscesae]|uniref:Hexosyltransferase n=1 Tax=Ridgeia piscesae TaxID=27915 RepID=A0AAD9JQM0_RIDPI|nr:hypothetical protein NP493_1883g00014 [Ridgeia piscesae]
MRSCPMGWRPFILLLSIFVGHRFFLLLFFTDWQVDDQAHVIDYMIQHDIVRLTTVANNRSEITTISKTMTTRRMTTTKTTMATTTMSPEQVPEQIYYRRQETIVNPFPYVLVTSPRTACPDGIILVIVVHSHPSYRDRRDAIRRTWGRYGNGQQGKPRSTRLVFALGVDPKVSADAVRAESEIYDDIIQGNFVDSYKNMTLKSLFGLKWVSEQCARVPYMLKSDDDTFISIPYLIEILQATRPTRSIMGPHNLGSPVYRTGRWAISKELFPFNRYPEYESGSGYVITVDIVRELYETSAYVTPLPIEDGVRDRYPGENNRRQAYSTQGLCLLV